MDRDGDGRAAWIQVVGGRDGDVARATEPERGAEVTGLAHLDGVERAGVIPDGVVHHGAGGLVHVPERGEPGRGLYRRGRRRAETGGTGRVGRGHEDPNGMTDVGRAGHVGGRGRTAQVHA